jgi:chromosome segregation ATPase
MTNLHEKKSDETDDGRCQAVATEERTARDGSVLEDASDGGRDEDAGLTDKDHRLSDALLQIQELEKDNVDLEGEKAELERAAVGLQREMEESVREVEGLVREKDGRLMQMSALMQGLERDKAELETEKAELERTVARLAGEVKGSIQEVEGLVRENEGLARERAELLTELAGERGQRDRRLTSALQEVQAPNPPIMEHLHDNANGKGDNAQDRQEIAHQLLEAWLQVEILEREKLALMREKENLLNDIEALEEDLVGRRSRIEQLEDDHERLRIACFRNETLAIIVMVEDLNAQIACAAKSLVDPLTLCGEEASDNLAPAERQDHISIVTRRLGQPMVQFLESGGPSAFANIELAFQAGLITCSRLVINCEDSLDDEVEYRSRSDVRSRGDNHRLNLQATIDHAHTQEFHLSPAGGERS